MSYVLASYVATGYFEDLGLGAEPFDSAGFDSAGEFAIYRNGYYDKFTNQYLASSTETWDDNNDSGGYTWDDFNNWQGTPSTPLTFLTDVVDTGQSRYYNPNVKVDASGPVDVWVYYGDEIDTSGAIITPGLFQGGQSQTLSGAKARYWQFGIFVEPLNGEIPYINAITSTVKSTPIEEIITDLDTSTIVDSAGYGTITPTKAFATITSVFIQPQADGLDKPIVYVRSKTTSGINFEIFDADTYGKTHTDCVVDVKITGLPRLVSDSNGNITEELA